MTRSTVKGVFWITAGRGLKAPLNLVGIAVLARLLTPTDFGIVAIGMLVKTFSDVLVDGSFGMVLVQRRTVSPPLIGASLALSVALAMLASVAVVLGAPYIQRQFDFPQLRDVLLVLGTVLPITAITTITTALLQRAMRFSALVLNAIVSQLVYMAVGISLAVAGMGLWSLVWGQVASFVVEALLGLFQSRRFYRIGFSTSAVGDVLASGGMFTIARLLGWASTSVDRLVIGRFLGAAELGFYTRAANLMMTARQLTGTGPVRVLFSSFAKIQHDSSRMRKGYLRALAVSLLIAALVSAFVIVNAEIIVRIMLGPKWLPTIPLIQILFAAFLARSGYIVAEAIPLALGLAGANALRHGAHLIFVFVGAIIGAQFGLVGAATGIAISHWLFYLLCLLLVRRLLQVEWLQTLRLHVNSILVASGPTLLALATRWIFPSHDILMQAVPALVFGITAVAILLFGPANIVTDDLVRARTYVWERLASRLARRT